jgi:hypothetical protein
MINTEKQVCQQNSESNEGHCCAAASVLTAQSYCNSLCPAEDALGAMMTSQ